MEKIKQFLISEKGKDVLTVLIVILVGLGSFELGRLSKESDSLSLPTQADINNKLPDLNNNQDNNIVQPEKSTQTSAKTSNTKLASSGKTFFASTKGSKYYPTNCAAGKTIKQENKVWFITGKDAEAAGYKLSSSCN